MIVHSNSLFSISDLLVNIAFLLPFFLASSSKSYGARGWSMGKGFLWWVNNERLLVRVESEKGFVKRRGAGVEFGGTEKGASFSFTNEAGFLLIPFMLSYFYMLFSKALSHVCASLNKSQKITAKCIKIIRH